MDKGKHTLLLMRVQENKETYDYLGSDGLSIEESYSIYLRKCAEFMANAKKYKRENLNLKNSLLHQTKYGYENSDQFEDEVLIKRNEDMKNYNKTFDVTLFNDNPNCMYQNTKGLSKRIRIVRELEDQNPVIDFSENFATGTKCWFTRFCILSKFIQAARMIVILNRLQKRLEIFKNLTLDDIKKYEINNDVIEIEQPKVNVTSYEFPCNYCPK